MVKHTRHIRAGENFLSFQQSFKKSVKPLIGKSERHLLESPWLTDRIADILENDLDFTRSTVRQLKKRHNKRRKL